ncbi:hypothetical protein BDV95DRAFT_581279 [Massariosphaeria phaeospora]|uniref:Uncharacterized protein n=1 Tax=Massariosphaeria phaeospora TaxID=100035 RepID=A0A7C8M9N7_9PLEO|nr:hypothetical protein BDV95DRAFT_581279 [Massariosphaeria phaeospora]
MASHAATEAALMAIHVKMLLKYNIINAEFAAKFQPWQEKGVLEFKWDEKHLEMHPEYVPGGEEIMDLKKAEQIQKKKDAAEKKFLENWRMGLVDADGKPVKLITKEKREDTEPSSSSSAIAPSLPTPKKKAEKKAPKTPAPRKILAPKSKLPTPPSPQRKARLTLGPNRPDYEPYKYNQLAALCEQRNIISKGSEHDLRDRLIQDDINVDNGLPREARAYAGKRDRKTVAPIVPNAPVAGPAIAARRNRENEKKRKSDESEESPGSDESEKDKENKKRKIEDREVDEETEETPEGAESEERGQKKQKVHD